MRYSVRAKIFALVLLQSNPALAQTDLSPQFVPLWQDFLSLCGPIVSDPGQSFSKINSLAEGNISTWATSADGSSIHGSISTPDYAREASMHIHKNDSGFNIFCEAHIFTETPFDVLVTASSIRQLLTASNVMTVAGGELTDVGTGSSSLAETGQAPWVSFSASGVFPTAAFTTAVDIQSGSVTITVFGFVN